MKDCDVDMKHKIKESDIEKKIYLIDGSAYIYRAFHAIRSLSNSKGLPTNAVLGFTKMILKLFNEKKPDYVGIFFDSKELTFRHKLFNDYKANRPPMPDDLSVQIPYIKKIVKYMNLQMIQMPGYEADDLIGTICKLAQNKDFSVIMVTGDKDFMQLVTENAVIYDTMKKKIIDLTHIKKTYDIDPDKFIDVMGLSGDRADNVPGVPGIGQKTALSLIKEYGSIGKLYDQLDSITKKKQKQNLIDYKEQALLSKKLVTIDTCAPVLFDPDEFKFKKADSDKLCSLFKELEFSQLHQAFSKKIDLSIKKYLSVLDKDKLSILITQLKTSAIFAIDTETSSKNPMNAKLVGLSFSTASNKAYYIPCKHNYIGAPKQLKLSFVLDQLKPVLEDPNIKKIGQNIKYDCIVLKRHGINLKGISFDTMVASYLINPSKRAHNLDQIAIDFLDYKKISYKEIVNSGSNKSSNISGFSKVDVEKAVFYACEDADITFMAYKVFLPKLEEAGLFELFQKVEMPLVLVLTEMEMSGICIDKKKLASFSKSVEKQLDEIEDNIYLLAGEQFNIKSSKQLGHILFEKLNMPVQKKTKKSKTFSTDVEVLKKLAAFHELPVLILRHRTLSKLKSTYADALVDLVHPETGRIHTSYNQTVTATGRLSSSNPNLQNIPIRSSEGKKIREAFIPRKGWVLMAADYSQIELRILAHYSDDKLFVNAFNNDEDIHTLTATEIFQITSEHITPELRQQAKIINFGIIYGMSPYGLAKELGISQKMAKSYINNYFARYKGVKKFIDHTINKAREEKKTSTLLNRIRLLPDIASENKTTRNFAERIAINTPIQGTAADLIKVAMINVLSALEKQDLKAAMLLSVHDEIILEVPLEEVDMVTNLVTEIMEQIFDLKVPLKINIQTGENWAQAH